jgi:hypothetical protein
MPAVAAGQHAQAGRQPDTGPAGQITHNAKGHVSTQPGKSVWDTQTFDVHLMPTAAQA